MTINPTPMQVIQRHKSRIKILELALIDAREEQKQSLQEELNRRKNELEELKKAIDF